jgi:deoxyadenosine/deoxycytidine kinase
LQKRLPKPGLIVYLKGSDDLIIDRIHRRNRSIEQIIDVEYFKKLKRAYDEAFLRGARNVHVIDADHFDCLNDPTALEKICLMIDSVAVRAPRQ